MSAQQALGLAWLLNEHGEDVMLQQQGHWLTVDFFTREIVYCIWDTTGAVHATESLGGGVNNAVADDPVYTPGDFVNTHMPTQRLLQLLHKTADERDKYKATLEGRGR